MNALEVIFTLSKTARIFKALASDLISENTEMLHCYFTVPKDVSSLWDSQSVLRDVQGSENILTWVQRDVLTPSTRK